MERCFIRGRGSGVSYISGAVSAASVWAELAASTGAVSAASAGSALAVEGT